LNICFALQAVPSATPSSFYGSREPPPRAHYEPRILEHEKDLDHWRPGETISPMGRFRGLPISRTGPDRTGPDQTQTLIHGTDRNGVERMCEAAGLLSLLSQQ